MFRLIDSRAVVLKFFSERIILIKLKIQSIKDLNFDKKSAQNLLKYLHIRYPDLVSKL